MKYELHWDYDFKIIEDEEETYSKDDLIKMCLIRDLGDMNVIKDKSEFELMNILIHDIEMKVI